MTKSPFTLAKLLLTVSLTAACLQPVHAQLAPPAGSTTPPNWLAQTGQPNFTKVDTNYAAFALTNNQTASYTPGGSNTTQITVRQNTGLTLMLAVWQTNSVASTTTNYTVMLDTTGDGKTWTMGAGGHPIAWTVSLAGAGASTNVYWTNIPASALNNVRKVQCTGVSTTASNNIFGSLLYS